MKNYSLLIIKTVLLFVLVWSLQTLFLYEVINNGIAGDDLEWLFYFHAYRGDLISQFPFIWNERTIYIVQQIYYMGIIQGIFGFLNLPSVQLIHLFFKALAALSLSFLIFKLLKDKIFAFLTVFFFIISPSTAGIFEVIIQGTSYLSISFICLFILFYIQSFKDNKKKKILLASFFFFLALVLCPPRSFPIILIPIFVELVRLRKEFKPFVFLRRLLIFYLIPYILFAGQAKHVTGGSWGVHVYDFTAGNYYSITHPFQVISSLFIDRSLLGYIFPIWNNVNLNVVLILQLFLLPLSLFLGLIIKIRNIRNFLIKITLLTFLLQGLFYLLGIHSHNLPPGYAIIQQVNFNASSFIQASIGGYFVLFGLFLVCEWWWNKRNNKIMMVLSLAWFWTLICLILIWFSAGGVQMTDQNDRRYVLPISLGSIVFTAGIFTLTIEEILKIRKLIIKMPAYFLLGMILFIVTFANYKFLNGYFYEKNQKTGSDSGWQKIMFQRFLDKFGQVNLHKDALIYLDYSKADAIDKEFYKNSVGIFYKLIYFDNGYLVRGHCKAVVSDLQVLKKSYKIINGEKGFMIDSPPTLCVNPVIGQDSRANYFSLDNFYAYSLQNKEFIDIKEGIVNKFDKEEL